MNNQGEAGKQARAVFLDRDGVINAAIVRNGKPYPPDSVKELKILPGVDLALKKLHSAGYLLIVITNQPDVSKGKQKIEVVEEMNHRLQTKLKLDDIMVCYHDDIDNCECRKPKPGMLLQAAVKFNINLAGSYMVGDRWKDVLAGKSAGCRTFFIDRGYTETQEVAADFNVSSLLEAAEIILGL